MQLKLILLDFDGTLADTRRANTLAYLQTLREAGYTLTEEEYAARYFGMRCEEFLTRIGIADAAERERLRLRKIALYPDYFDTVRLNEPLWNFCREFQRGGGRVWIVSTGSRANIEHVMRHLGLGARPGRFPQTGRTGRMESTERPTLRWGVSTASSRGSTSRRRNRLRTAFWRRCAARDAPPPRRSSSRIRRSVSKRHAAAVRPTSA